LEENNISEQIKFFDDILIYPIGLDESYGLFIVNYLNEFCKNMNFQHRFNLGYKYDLLDKSANHKKLWILISDGDEIKTYDVANYVDNYIVFNFADHKKKGFGIAVPAIAARGDRSALYSLRSLYVSILISKSILDTMDYADSMSCIVRDNIEGLRKALDYLYNSRDVDEEVNIAVRALLSKRNWKCLGSGVNYNAAKFAAKMLIWNLNRACAFDVLENHKHIDISAESAAIVFIANIWRHGYQHDALSEIEKLVSHDNIPIIVTNIGDTRFDDVQMKVNYGAGNTKLISIPIVKVPNLNEAYTFPLNVLLIEKFIRALKRISMFECQDIHTRIALKEPSSLRL